MVILYMKNTVSAVIMQDHTVVIQRLQQQDKDKAVEIQEDREARIQ